MHTLSSGGRSQGEVERRRHGNGGADLARNDMNSVTGDPAQSLRAGHGGGGAHASRVGKARGFTLGRRQQVAGWLFLTPAVLYLLFASRSPSSTT